MLHVLYLIFNEGYTTSAGPHLQRLELSREAIRLTRCVHALLPDDAEVAGLLALMLLTDARRLARTGPDGELIPLTKQDRTLWDQAEIAEGIALLTAALSKGSIGPYQLQAAIAAVHDEAGATPRIPTGRRSWRCMNCSSACPTIPWWRSITPSPRPWCTAHPKGSSCSARSTPMRELPAIIASTPFAPICWKWPATVRPQSTHYRIAANRTTSMPERNYLMTQAARLERGCSELSLR